MLCSLMRFFLTDAPADDSEHSIRKRGRMLCKWHGLVRVEAYYFAKLETMSAEIFGLNL